jgi:FkbM family methyltransferase
MISDIPISDRLLTAYFRSGWRGFDRLWHMLSDKKTEPFITAYNKYGAKLLLNPLDYIDSFVLLSGYYESEVLEAILPYLHSDAVLWDIGANFGLHGITAKHLKPEAKVICIEPSPFMITRMQANSRLNDVDVDIVGIALSDRPGLKHLHFMEGNPGMTTLKPLAAGNYAGKLISWCDTGDSVVAAEMLPSPTVIKLDVEGSEVDVLRGLTNVLSESRVEAIVLEGEPNLLSTDGSELHKIVKAAGFNMNALSRNEKTHHHLDNFIAVRNLSS